MIIVENFLQLKKQKTIYKSTVQEAQLVPIRINTNTSSPRYNVTKLRMLKKRRGKLKENLNICEGGKWNIWQTSQQEKFVVLKKINFIL